ncbi:beta strand repeat-containing protein [Ensifer soli]|uniref:beta strand repeat-containing protein n=1 Tax=Ciceribacter sp. sgz301302 TaxID=3342379 RepID=UPI0035B95112
MATFSLTTGVDTLNGGGADDTFNVENGIAKLTATDTIDGGGGTDTLRFSNIANLKFNPAILAATTSIEVLDFSALTTGLQVTLDAGAVGQSSTGRLTVSYGSNAVFLDVSAVGAGGGTVLNGTGQVTLRTAENQVMQIADGVDGRILGAGGADRITGGSGNDVIDGAAGNDLLSGGTGTNTINGGLGDDIITMGVGADTVTGGDGNDTFILKAGGSATITDFDHASLVEFIDLSAFATVKSMSNLTIGSAGGNAVINVAGTLLTLEGVAASSLTAGDFLFNGVVPPRYFFITSATDTFTGGAGNDLFIVEGSLTKLTSADRLNGGTGTDTLHFTNPTVTLGPALLGGVTSIEVFDFSSVTTSLTVTVDAAMVGQATGDALRLKYGSNAMLLDVSAVGSAGKVFLDGTGLVRLSGLGDQVVTVAGGVNGQVQGAGGADTIAGGTGNDTLSGGAGEDTLSGGTGTNTISGEDGNDVITVGTGKDRVTGGAGFDTFVLKSGNASTITDFDHASLVEFIDLTAFTTVKSMSDLTLTDFGTNVRITIGKTTLTLEGVSKADLTASEFLFNGAVPPKYLFVTSNVDTLVGSVGKDLFIVDGSLTKLTATDTLSGGEGEDTLYFTAPTVNLGASILAGVTSVEVFDFTSVTTSLTVQISAAVAGQAADDTLRLKYGANAMLLDLSTVGSGGRVLLDGTGQVTLRGFANQVALIADGVDGKVQGAGAADVITGGTGNDTIGGGAGNDRLDGGTGINTIDAGAGNDTITLGAGTDRVTGGAGDDMFVLKAGGAATITDFDHASLVEVIDLRGFTTIKSLDDIGMTNVGGDVVLDIAGTTLTLEGRTSAQLTEAEFLFDGVPPPQTFYITSGVDSFTGGAGNDQFIVDGSLTKLTATDKLSGGSGSDTVYFTGATVNLAPAITAGFFSIETLDFSKATTSLTVTVNAAMVDQSSNDVLRLKYGSNAMLLDVSRIVGDTTTPDGAGATSGEAVGKVLLDGTGLVTLRGYENQVVTMANRVNGNVQGAGGADVIDGGSGHDTLRGGGGNDDISGNGGNDRLFGEDGNDLLDGGAGTNTLSGGAGYDKIVIGTGTDTVSGGADGDIYVVKPGGGTATITDFQVGTLLEQIDLRAFGTVSGLSDLTMTDGPNGVTIDVQGTQITLNNVTQAQMTAAKFLFANSPPAVYHVAAGTSVEEVQALLDGAGPGVTVELAAGEYHWDQRLTITNDNVTLRGAGAGETVIYHDIPADRAESAILAYAKGNDEKVGTFTASTAIDARTITLDSVGSVKAGDVIYVSQVNDAAYIAETGNQEWARILGEEAFSKRYILREALVEVTAVNGNTLTLSHELPYAFAAGKATVETVPMLSGLAVSGFTVKTDGPAPNPIFFENVDDRWLSKPTIEFRGVRDSDFSDVSVINARSVPMKFQTAYNMTGTGLLVDGAFNKLGGDGYGFYLQEAFNNHFKDVTTLNVRHGVITSAASAEHYNTVEVTYTNRDVNFHGGPDSRNTILIKEMVLEYGDGDLEWRAVSPGSPPEHPYSTIEDNDVRFIKMTGGNRPDTVYGADSGSTLNGMGGDDRLYGGSGVDRIIGGGASDTLNGNGGNDYIQGDSGVDTIDGGAGADQLYGGTEDDRIAGGSGADLIYGQDGDDTLDGGTDADRISGGNGFDTITTGAGTDRVWRAYGEGTDTITDFTPGTRGDVLVLRGFAAKSFGELTLIQSGADTLVEFGQDGEVILKNVDASKLTSANFAFETVGTATVINAGNGHPVVMGTDGSDTIALGRAYLENGTPVVGGAGTDVIALTGTMNLDTATFNLKSVEVMDISAATSVRLAIRDSVLQQSSNKTLLLKAGATGTLILDVGVPTAGKLVVDGTRTITLVSTRDNKFTVTGAGGTVVGAAAADHVTGAGGTDTFKGGGGNDTLIGLGGIDALLGEAGDDTLEGGAGADILNGGAGLDFASYAGATAAVTANLGAPGGNTRDAAGDVYTDIEGLIGSRYNDRLLGDAGANTLIGGSGLDTLAGGAGDDILIGGASADALNGGDGVDTASYATATVGLVVDFGNRANNTGDARNDTYVSIENLTGSAFDDDLRGNSVANVIDGGAGTNRLAGLAGNDTFIGGVGIDRFDGGTGIDTVTYAASTTGVTVSLASPAINTGLAAGDTFVSIETLIGSAFNDRLTGNTAANTLDGGLGADTMNGGTGNDTYYVDNAGDVVIDTGGIDRIISTLTYSLVGTEIENLTLIGPAARLNATGNDAANILIGNAGINRIDGGLGADRMEGGAGDDLYYVDNVGDRVIEAADGGIDMVYSKVSFSLAGQGIENLTLEGTANIDAVGNSFANTIRGNTGMNVITGGGGADKLYAGNDNVQDVFVYKAIGDSGKTAETADRLSQFDTAAVPTYTKSDKIDLSAIDAGRQAGDQAFRFVTDFSAPGTGEAAGQIRVIKDGANAQVQIDLNGDGLLDAMIIVEGVTAMNAWDFIL